jgi:hypothetical protein
VISVDVDPVEELVEEHSPFVLTYAAGVAISIAPT